LSKTITSETMKCPICSNNKWVIQKKLGGCGITIILLGWIIAVPTCAALGQSGVGPGFFGMDAIGLFFFFLIVVIAHLAAKSYSKRKYKCAECGHTTSGN
jgi:transposase-like protein